MNIKNGDKLVVKESIAGLVKGDEVTVADLEVEDNCVSLYCDIELGAIKITTDISLLDDYFYKIPTMTQERIDEIMENSEFIFQTIFDKCTVVACRLPNGYVIVESSACVDPDNYDEEMGVEICSRRIEDKLWELEAYRLQSEMYESDDVDDVDFDDNDADYDDNDDILDDDDCDCFWCNRCSQCQ